MKRKALMTLILVGVLCTALAGAAQKKGSAKAPPKPEHPAVDTSIACAECHADLTPEVVAAWSAGPHGMNHVLCFVCHGSTGEDFVKHAKPERCIGCHGDQVETMAHPRLKDKTCFSCHAPHALNPHWTPSGGER